MSPDDDALCTWEKLLELEAWEAEPDAPAGRPVEEVAAAEGWDLGE
jgi:hypothetical protein